MKYWVLAAISAAAAIELVSAPQLAPYTIAFSSFGPIDTDVFIANARGENAKPLVPNAALDYNASFSPDGRWVFFTSERAGSADIYRVHPDGRGLERLTNDPAFDDQASISPDGKHLAFVSARSGQADIWLMDLTTRRYKNITNNPGGDFRPAWSPDGNWIAFSSDRDSTKPKFNIAIMQSTEIYVMHPDGSGLRRLTHDQALAGSPTWSRDGRQIIYYFCTLDELAHIVDPRRPLATSQIASIDVQTGERRLMTSGSGEKLSPRNLGLQRVVYVSRGTDDEGIRFIGDGQVIPGEFESPAWSPDGQRMVFHREVDRAWPPVQRWATLDADFRLIRAGIFPSFSPSGDRLISNSARAGILHNSILTMNADGSKRSTLFDDPERSALAPAWSPRGDRIAFGLGGFFQMLVGASKQAVPAATSQIAIIRPDGTGLHVLGSTGEHAGFPSWSPDGKRLVYRAADSLGKGLRIVDIETERVTPLTNGPHNDNFPAWSPLGDRIAFTSDRDGDYEIHTIRLDGTDLKRLTRSPHSAAHCSWSPDGKWIAFTSTGFGFKDEAFLHPGNAQPDGEIFVMHPDGSDVRKLTDNPFEDGTPVWAPLKANKMTISK
jgi:TolB protein